MSSDAPDEKKKPIAVALLSGGLDSSLAVRMMIDQGIQVEAVAVKTPFCDFDCGKGCGHRVKEVADELGIKLKTVYFGENYLRMLKKPKHGYGSGMNPCIDCREMMYSAAKEHMNDIGADFLVTGEVLHQRPMSQNERALRIIEKETGMEGKVLRPLSAKHLPQTDAEKAGLVDRGRLGEIKGRSRKGQLQMASEYGIQEPPNAAGGCLLTDPAFSKRVEDAIDFAKDIPSLNDIELLKVGRHFRIDSNSKLVVGRNKEENDLISALALESDLLFEVRNYVGPISLLRSNDCNETQIFEGARIALRYSDAPKSQDSHVTVRGKGEAREILCFPSTDEEIIPLRI